MDAIERYVVLLYQWTSVLSLVNEARKQLFAFSNRKIENILPTLHVKRAFYQAGHIWGQSLIEEPQVPSPDVWGGERVTEDSQWTPCWTSLPEAAKGCQELLKCGCKPGAVLTYMFSIGMCRSQDPPFFELDPHLRPPFFELCPHLRPPFFSLPEHTRPVDHVDK